MYHRLAGNKRFLALLLVFFLAFIGMTYQTRGGDKLGLIRLSDNLFSIPHKVIGVITNRITGFWNHYLFLVGKSKENEKLIKEIERMRSEIDSYRNILEENKRLKDILSLKESQPNYIATVRVIGRDTGNWFRTIYIDKGEIDGLRKDMVAITPSGLVGRIYQIMPRTSRVLLITDRSSSLAVRIQRTRDEGILEGTGRNLCHLKYIPQSSELKVGDVILSSGLDGIFPEDLIIGTVSRVKRKGSDFFQEVDVIPATDITRLEEIIIVGAR